MRTIYKIGGFLVVFILACGNPFRALSHEADSLCVSIYFRRGHATWDPAFRGNNRTLESFAEILKKCQTSDSLHRLRLHLRGNASPDGSGPANARLSGKRAATVLSLLRKQMQLPDSVVSVAGGGIDWKGLAAMVEADSACPAQKEVLHILRNTPEWIRDDRNRIIDGRKKQLMDLRGGVPYNYLSEHFFPDLRNSLITLYGAIPGTAETEERRIDTLNVQNVQSGGSESASGVSPAHPLHRNGATSETSATAVPESVPAQTDIPAAVSEAEAAQTDVPAEAAPAEASAAVAPLHRLAVKTNLLYDAILMPDLEVEYRIDDRWSVAVDGSVAWWKKDSRHKYYQIATIVPEGRYWFRTKRPWHGHYVGLFAGGSWYDLENGNRGYKGEFFMTGISYGYMFPVGRAVSLEAGLGMGFLHTVYEEYLPIDGHYVYQQTSRTNWVGPVRVKFAVVWRLWDQNKGGRR